MSLFYGKAVKKYNKRILKTIFLEALSSLGGIEKYVSKGDKVLLKVNMLMKKKPDEATTTHPVFVEALSEILVEYGANVIIGDSPGGPFSIKRLNPMYTTCGFRDAAEKSGASLMLNTDFKTVSFPSGISMKNITVIEELLIVDKVISISKLKSHQMMKYTGAVKNLFGVIPGTIKAEYHFNRPHLDDFADSLTDICKFANPVLSFMDGILGMDGKGPSAGNIKNFDRIFISDNPYALDYTVSKLLKTDPLSIPTIKSSLNKKYFDPNKITNVGENLNTLIINDFDFPEIHSAAFIKNENHFLHFIQSHLLMAKPIFDTNLCIKCKDCMNNCPPGAIQMNSSGYPKVNLNKCIRCYCCQELCPKKAVEVSRPPLSKFLSKL